MNATWKAEIELLASLILTDYARVVIDEDRCLCPPALCMHEPHYELRMVNVHGDESWVDFIDSETVREAERRAFQIKRGK